MIYIVTDGSGHTDGFTGWGATVLTPTTTKVLYGCSYPGTVSRSELTPIIEALRHVYYDIAKKKKGLEVTIVSDSQYTVKVMSGLSTAHKNTDLWASYEEMATKFRIRPVWQSRNSHPLQTNCDLMAHAMRNAIKATKEPILDKFSKVKYEDVEGLLCESLKLGTGILGTTNIT